MLVVTSGGRPLRSDVSLKSESEQLAFGTKTRSYVARPTCSAHLKSSLNAGVSTFQNVIGTPSETLAYLLHAPCGKPSTLSSPSWNKSDVYVPWLGLGRNRISDLLEGTRYWTRKE